MKSVDFSVTSTGISVSSLIRYVYPLSECQILSKIVQRVHVIMGNNIYMTVSTRKKGKAI